VNGWAEATVTGERVTHLSCSPPLAAKVLPGPTLLLVGSAAGLLEGDRCAVRLRLGRRSRLMVRSTARVSLAAGAAAVWAETLSLGRSGEDAGDVELRLDVELDRVPLLRDGLRAGPSAKGSAGAAVLAGARHVGTVALLGARPRTDDPHVMDLAGPGALARALSDDAATVERRLAPAQCLFLSRLASPEEFSNVA
jgi:urease accessory protein UreH